MNTFKTEEEVVWKDSLGNYLVVGEIIVYSAMRGSTSSLQIGKITALRAKEYQPGTKWSTWGASIQIQGMRRDWNDAGWEKMRKSLI